ncbi:MAG TPA: uroporphyrinogen-III C-methyltransferase, partial [Methanocorpusculum sp.]|nr:uroporphyrinogen-III C-methyltransferase [Methanocorpusculum sp.]
MDKGSVCLVGAGPGGLSLITPAALKAVAGADIIYYDRLLGPDIIAFLPKTAELIDVGKNPDGSSVPQSQINQMLGDSALEGKRVVRLKGGDPFVFGRGGEEMEYLRNLGVPVTFVPGITSGIAVPESVGIPVTHRGISRSVTLVTGHEGSAGKTDWSWYAKCPGTLVIYMGSSRIDEIATALCA